MDDDEPRASRSAKTSQAIKTVGHGASGGHNPILRATAVGNRANWSHDSHHHSHRSSMDYQYQEYPKWVYPEGKPPVIVNGLEEEAAVMAGSETDERSRLLTLATDNGVSVDRRWKLERIAQALADAGISLNDES